MNRTITFNELRKIKDSLPTGSMHRIADELNLSVETVRNFFGGHNFKDGKSVGIHLEPGPDGGLVMLDDTTVLDKAIAILKEEQRALYKIRAVTRGWESIRSCYGPYCLSDNMILT